jgi:hypothetical protein
VDQQADNDYYFAGVYSNTIPSVVSFYSAYAPVGVVTTNEECGRAGLRGTDKRSALSLQPSNLAVIYQPAIGNPRRDQFG